MKLLDYADVGPTKGVKGTYVGSVTHGSPTYAHSSKLCAPKSMFNMSSCNTGTTQERFNLEIAL